jgi:hypothetical protein
MVSKPVIISAIIAENRLTEVVGVASRIRSL